MSLMINLLVALFSGRLTNFLLGKSEHSILGYLAIGIIGNIIGYFLFENFITNYTHPILAKLIANLMGSMIFQVALNIIRRERKEEKEAKLN